MDQQPNLTCAICGENDFHLKEGFYYCNECGTKSEQVRAIEVEMDDEFEPRKRKTIKKIKVKTDKNSSDKPELTSWECYNYILRGIVEELIELGAKDELKLMAFQIWAAFLRNKEVAFFARRHAELPKLGIRFEEKDVAILYNQARERHKARREKKENASNASGSRKWRKQVKKYDQSQYEASLSQSQSVYSTSFMSSSLGDGSFNSSGSAPTNRAIQLKFSSRARKELKKRMPLSHLKKHEKDFNSSLKCHDLTVKYSELKNGDRYKELTMKLVFSILALALNLIEDEIQLTDLLRFISEGHISIHNLERFFPPNTTEAFKSCFKSFRLHCKNTDFGSAPLRLHSAQICKGIHLKHLKTPDIFKLVQRYTMEMCLPEEINTFIERLINLHPPKMNFDNRSSTPCYEGRAMAYIIFTLKLFFGIDGRKEKEISRSARRINAELKEMNLPNYDELFVWDDWVEYIELRKVILCKNSLSVCKQFKQIPQRELYLQHLEQRIQTEGEAQDLSKTMFKTQKNMKAIFQHFLNVGEKDNNDSEATNFTPSFTPCLSYLKRLKLDPKINETLPELLNEDHSKRTLMPFLKPAKLKETFAKCGRNLSVIRVACTSKQNYVGIFRNPFIQNRQNAPWKVNLTDDSKAWNIKVEADKPDASIFKTTVEVYGKKYMSSKIRKQKLNSDIDFSIKNEFAVGDNDDFDCFNEDNMEPGNINFTAPRRDLEKISLFADLSEDEDYEDMDQSNISEEKKCTKLKISNFDCWHLMGKASELNETQTNELKRKLQLTFFWLLETCAHTIRVDWRELYDQLMVLETFFAYTIEPLENFKDRIIFKKVCEIKDKNRIVQHFQSNW